MNHLTRLLITLLVLSCSTGIAQNKPALIFDTDFGGDADDLGALAMLHEFINRDECELLAVMCWNVEPSAVSAIHAVNTFYGNESIPIGTRKDPGDSIPWNHSRAITDQLPYMLTKENAPNSTDLYRKILSQQPDQSVTIITVGPLSNIQRLIESKAGPHSSLTGQELISRKVKEFVIMGGQFPEGEKEWNFDGNMKGVTRFVIENLTAPITFLGYEIGLNIKSGEIFNQLAPSHPLYLGFYHFSKYCPWLNHQFQEAIYDNSTYDQTAVLYAVRGGVGHYWERIEDGYCRPDDTGGNQWISGGDRSHSYLKLLESEEQMAVIIEAMMTGRF